jgi:peroxiredoxin/mono/diheme cytochrome c family protein
MSMRRSSLLLGALFLCGIARAADVPASISGFRLNEPLNGKTVDFASLKSSKAVVVVFLGTECPINNAYLPELASLHKEFSGRGVSFVGINSNRQDTPGRIAEHARKNGIPFPVLVDVGSKVADAFGARRTPEVLVVSPEGKVFYRGRIDDQFGLEHRRPDKPTRRDLAEALGEILAGKPVSVAETTVAGCRIARPVTSKTGGAVTYTKHIADILQRNCQECHRAGQVGPMALSSYDDAIAWAETIREVVSDGRMPPWYADPAHGKWANDRRLSKEDRANLLAWLDHGTPKGEEKDLPAPRKFSSDWVIGKPDVVFQMPEAFAVPAEAPKDGIPYKRFIVKTNFTEDRWIERAETRPGAPEVVHHIVIFIVPPGVGFRPDLPGAVLAGTAPGEMPLMLEPGFAKKIPAGSRLLFEMHYTPNGRAQSDRSELGLVFAKKPPRHQVLTFPIDNRWFTTGLLRIPAGVENFEMQAIHTFKEDVHVMSFMPHMHLRGKDFRYGAILPNGNRQTLLSVPHYNFNWQTLFRATEPIALPKGTKLHCVAHYDNSAKNPNNPDPSKSVGWGDQTWEEMMLGWIDYYVDEPKP